MVQKVHFFGPNFAHMKTGAGTGLSKSAIWDEFSEQHQHQSLKKAQYLNIYKHFLMQLKGLCLIRVMSNFYFLDPGPEGNLR